MNLKKYTKHVIFVASLLSMAALFSRCTSSSSGDAAAAGVTISGTVGSIAASSMSSSKVGIMAVSATDLEVYGLALSDPPEVQKVNLGADGSFSLSFSSAAAGSEISLIFRYKAGTENAGKQIGLVKFVDDSQKNMDGTSSSSTSMKLSGTVSLGSLTINADGEVNVPVSQVATNNQNQTVTSGTATDFTGTWQFAAYDSTVPEGYDAACAADDMNCKGPRIGESVYLKVLAGKEFTPAGTCNAGTAEAGTCDGTVGTADRFAMSIWRSSAAWATCGNKLGFPYSLARFYANADFTSSGVPEGAHTFTAGWTDGWIKNPGATATHPVSNCSPVNVTMPDASTKIGFKCYDNTSVPNSYRIDFGGGCRDTATNAPVQITDWSGVTGGACTSTTAGLPNGFKTSTCTFTNVNHDGDGTTAALNLTCPFTYGTFSQVDDSAIAENGFNWTNSQFIAQGAACGDPSAGTASEKIAKMRCHAEYYYSQQDNAALCLQRMTLNHATNDPTLFARPAEGAPKANSQHIMALFNYTSPTSGVIEDDEVHYSGVQSGNTFIPCKVKSHFKISMKARSATQAVIEFVSEETSLDFTQPACAAANQTMKTIMLMNKQ